jgi:phage tail tape measure protein, TP901 family|nr:MAG TPA: minor tail protein [Caudoviricetes sp.]
MNKDYYIRLQAKIDDSSKTVGELNKQIKTLENQIDDLKIRVDAKEVKNVTGQYRSLDEALKSVDSSLDKNLTGWTQQNQKLKTTNATVTTYKNALGDTLEVTTRLNNGHQTFGVSLTKVNTELAKNVIAANSSAAQYQSYDNVLKALNVDLTQYQKISSTQDSNGNVVEKWTNNSGKIITMTGKMVDGQKKYIATMKEVNDSVEQSAKQADKWKYSWAKAVQSFLTYQTVMETFYQFKNAVNQMVEEVIKLDSALVELQKVTDLEGHSLEKFTNKAFKAASTVAKSGTDMVKAATEFAKAGYKDEDQILELGRLALMYTNIADEEVNAAQASEFIISQMKAFNIEAKDAMHIIDAVNEVANNFAVSSADIANNLGKSSAVMSNAGNSYEQMIGLIRKIGQIKQFELTGKSLEIYLPIISSDVNEAYTNYI